MTDTQTKSTLSDTVMSLESQVGDILGELDTIAKKSKTRDRIRTLSTRLRYLEMRRHHTVALEAEAEFRQQALATFETITETCDVWLRQQQQIQVAPGHAVRRFSGMGLKVEASGKEDDPHFQQVADLIAQISNTVTGLKKTIVEDDLRERREHNEAKREGEENADES